MLSNLNKKFNSIRKNYPAYVRRYLWPLPKFRREIVVMIDGKLPHGGLTDRFRNILSVYSYCKKNDIPFKLFYDYPCDLTAYLLPNQYDWRIKASELSSHFLDTKEIVLYVIPYNLSDEDFKKRNNEAHIKLLNEELGKKRKVQYHLYGNSFFAEGQYSELFKELFKPSSYLEQRINQWLNCISEPYEAVTLRFQQLLGDFEEGNFVVLPVDERNELIQKCLSKIKELYVVSYFSTQKILVTSDSPSFLAEVSKLPFVFVIPGKMEHMDFTHNADVEMNVKSFVDLFLLMKAKKITLLRTGKMYKSGFPGFAAELGGIGYNEIYF